jgi:hypothetical protein
VILCGEGVSDPYFSVFVLLLSIFSLALLGAWLQRTCPSLQARKKENSIGFLLTDISSTCQESCPFSPFCNAQNLAQVISKYLLSELVDEINMQGNSMNCSVMVQIHFKDSKEKETFKPKKIIRRKPEGQKQFG